MKKLISVVAIPLLALTLSACGNGNHNNKNSSSKATTSQSTQKSADGNIDFDRFHSIKIGNSMTGDGGTSEAAVRQSFGKPSSTTKTDVNGKQTTALTWDKLNSAFKAKSATIGFVNGKAISKGYANLSADQVKPLDKTKVNAIHKGASFDDVINQLGAPHADTEAGSGQQSIKTIIYVTNKNGSATSFVFVDGKLNTKTETKID
ncbi:DUF3862 domain-containing protein [Lactobacillaceae bacterium Melli_B3]